MESHNRHHSQHRTPLQDSHMSFCGRPLPRPPPGNHSPVSASTVSLFLPERPPDESICAARGALRVVLLREPRCFPSSASVAFHQTFVTPSRGGVHLGCWVAEVWVVRNKATVDHQEQVLCPPKFSFHLDTYLVMGLQATW